MTDEIILDHPNGSLVKLLSNWKDYPIDQYNRELVIGNAMQANFKLPEKDKCGGTFKKILHEREGWIIQCDKCGFLMPLASHTVWYTNWEQVLQTV